MFAQKVSKEVLRYEQGWDSTFFFEYKQSLFGNRSAV